MVGRIERQMQQEREQDLRDLLERLRWEQHQRHMSGAADAEPNDQQ